MEDPKRTIAKLRRQLVATQNELSVIQKAARAAENATASEQKEKLNRLKGMIPSLDRYYIKYEDSYNELLVLSDELEELTFPTEQDKKECSIMRNAYYEIKATLENLLESRSLLAAEVTRTSLSEGTNIVHELSTSHLPEIKLEKFDGEILNWPKFRDTFVSIVHEDKNLSPTKKFHYLRTSVMGPALTMISKFQITDSNYPLAWTSLCEAYDKKRLLATAYLNQVINFTPIQGKPNVESLKTFMVQVCDSISAFQLLAIADESKFILFHLAYRLLDQTTREQFQNSHKDTDFPTFDQLCTFIKDKCFSMQLSLDTNASFDNFPSSNSKFPKEFRKGRSNGRMQLKSPMNRTSLVTNPSKPPPTQNKHPNLNLSSLSPCFVCRERSHGLLSCKMFCQADVKQRISWLENWKGCRNCLSSRHEIEDCKSKWVCRWCKQRHNSMICERLATPSTFVATTSNTGTCCVSQSIYTATEDNEASYSHIILGTCVAEILDARGMYQTVRLVIDSASHYSFMTNNCANRLGLLPNKCNMTIGGIGGCDENIKSFVNCIIKPTHKSEPHLNTKALLLKTITSHLPTTTLPRSLWVKYIKFPLADPKFYESKPVDMLLGADLFGDLWLGGPIKIDSASPRLFPTIFGHVIIGKFTNNCEDIRETMGTSLIATNQITINEINSNLVRFWEIEEPKTPTKSINPEDAYCEDHFQITHFRLSDGSYGVRLPFRSKPPEFTNIAAIALRRFHNLENRLSKQTELRGMYHEFIKQMENLGHMTSTCNPPAYIIPHHHVSKVDRNEIKIRVVFHCSTQANEGSLNDYLLVGPKLHTDIRDVLLNFRTHKIALVSDCVKMFRGIWMHPEDRKYQTIYWRFNPFDALKVYELNTLVYGAASSPFLANRVIRKIVEDHGEEYPEASKVLLRDIYVDDVVSGCRSIEEAKTLQHQLIMLLGKGKLKLSKWASNVPELLINVSEKIEEPINLISKDDTTIKILGLQWNPKTDCFGYTLDLPIIRPSKRTILSTVSKIYDLLGFICPLVIKLKKFIQDLWKLGLDWDQPVPKELRLNWETLLKELPIISDLRIPRFICNGASPVYQIIGFSDASEMAYCAVLYLRIITRDGIESYLLTAKTKLAPLKTLTIPRLELCGCLLLTKLYQSITEFLNLLGGDNFLTPLYFTDSTIALGWLQTPTYKLRTFVCNRVNDILQSTNPDQWHHVLSSDNPADCGSRGVLPQELLNNQLWWKGPLWLSHPESEWNLRTPTIIHSSLPEIKSEKPTLVSVKPFSSFHDEFIVSLISKFSSFNRLLRTLAYMLRFIHNLKAEETRSKGPLRVSEISSAEMLCVTAVQRHIMFEDDQSEKGQAKILKKFIKLNPFFDTSGILRAGGRLYNAHLPYNQKHPVLLPSNCHLTTLIVDHFHRMYLHPGPSLLQAVVQLRFWIPSLRRLVRKCVFNCSRCYRLKAKSFIPKMADLPPQRVQRPARAFLRTGVDFAGPFLMRESRRRKAAVAKVYLCIFICMSTKAIHVEVVTNLTADAFLAALDRFAALRGVPIDLYSDCGSNFLSAARKLKEWYAWYATEEAQIEIANKATVRQINWHFNPPYAPHFGGIWEAGVKSAKSLMTRTIGDTVLTYEELATLVAKIAAVLNSRPITPLSDDPSESEYLSPGHFLIGEAPLAIPEPTLLDVNINRLDRWQLIKRMSQYFWERWHKEYLSTLQMRNKWAEDTVSLKPGDLVFLRNENQPIMQWARGRIVDVHPGRDGKARVATVKTASSAFLRPVAQLVPLFHQEAKKPEPYTPPTEEKRRYAAWLQGSDSSPEEKDVDHPEEGSTE